MSGFEIAGVVLGSLPLLLNSANSFRKVFEKSKDWWDFEETVDTFIAKLREEDITYRLVLQRLLGPENYEEVLEASDPYLEVWNQPHMLEALESRFGWDMQRNFFKKLLQKLSEDIQDLNLLLPSMEQFLDEDVGKMEQELHRLRLSFSSKKDGLLNKLIEGNKQLHGFLDRVDQIPKPTKERSRIVAFARLHEQATLLHGNLSDFRNCSCGSAHHVSVTMSLLSQTQKTRDDANHRITSAQVRADSCLEALLQNDSRRGLMSVELLNDYLSFDHDENHTAPADDTVISSDRIQKLAAQRRAKRQQDQAVSMHKMKNAGILASSVANTPLLTAATAGTISTTPKKGLGKRAHDLFSSIGTSKVSLRRPREPGDHHSKVQKSQDSAVHHNMSCRGTDEHYVVEDICDLMERVSLSDKPARDRKHSLFQLGRDAKVALRLREDEHIAEIPTEALQICSIIDSKTCRRFERLEIGIRLCLTVLSLATTPWLPETWDRQGIIVLGNFASPSSRNLSGPYFPHGPVAMLPGAEISDRWHARRCLLQLGVLLLELLHGIRIEQQPSWDDALEDGEPNESTLLESAFLWAKRSSENLEEWFGPDGGLMCEAIRKCICFDFRYTGDSGNGSSKLAETVFQEVAIPLQSCHPKKLVKIYFLTNVICGQSRQVQKLRGRTCWYCREALVAFTEMLPLKKYAPLDQGKTPNSMVLMSTSGQAQRKIRPKFERNPQVVA